MDQAHLKAVRLIEKLANPELKQSFLLMVAEARKLRATNPVAVREYWQREIAALPSVPGSALYMRAQQQRMGRGQGSEDPSPPDRLDEGHWPPEGRDNIGARQPCQQAGGDGPPCHTAEEAGAAAQGGAG
jgi:hypothetical protein